MQFFVKNMVDKASLKVYNTIIQGQGRPKENFKGSLSLFLSAVINWRSKQTGQRVFVKDRPSLVTEPNF